VSLSVNIFSEAREMIYLSVTLARTGWHSCDVPIEGSHSETLQCSLRGSWRVQRNKSPCI